MKTSLQTLGELGDPRAIPILIDTLKNVFFKIQVAALIALGKLRTEEAVEPVWELLLQKDIYPVYVQLVAIHTLGRIGNKAAINHLREIINNSNWDDPKIKDKTVKMLNLNNSGV